MTDYILRHDLLKHLYLGFFIFFFTEWIFILLSETTYMDFNLNSIIALATVVAVALTKELVLDKRLGKGTPEVSDVIYTITPALIMFIR